MCPWWFIGKLLLFLGELVLVTWKLYMKTSFLID